MLIGITGATSKIGAQLATMLRAKGHRVRMLSRTPQGSPYNEGIEWRPLDLIDAAETMTPQLEGVDLVVHLAAKVPGNGPRQDAERDYWEVNVLGTQRLAEAMAKAGVPRLVLAAAANAYDPDQAEVSEMSAFHPRARILYLASKVVQEWHGAATCKVLGINCAVLRISSVVGDGKSVLDNLARQLASGNQIALTGGGMFGADFISCQDVCQGLDLAIENNLSGIYNLSSGKRTLLLDCVVEMASFLNCGPDVIRLEPSEGTSDPGFPAVNCDRLRAFGYTPTMMKEILKNICIEAREQVRLAQ